MLCILIGPHSFFKSYRLYKPCRLYKSIELYNWHISHISRIILESIIASTQKFLFFFSFFFLWFSFLFFFFFFFDFLSSSLFTYSFSFLFSFLSFYDFILLIKLPLEKLGAWETLTLQAAQASGFLIHLFSEHSQSGNT